MCVTLGVVTCAASFDASYRLSMLISNDANTKRYFGFDRPADSVFTRWTRVGADTIVVVVFDHADSSTIRFTGMQVRELRTFLGEYEHFVYESDAQDLRRRCPLTFDRLHVDRRDFTGVDNILILGSDGRYLRGQLIWGDERGLLLDTSAVPFDPRVISVRSLQWMPLASIQYVGRDMVEPDWLDMMRILGRMDALTAAITTYMKKFPVYTSSVPPELLTVLSGGVAPMVNDPTFPDYELLTLLPPTTMWALVGMGYTPFVEAPQYTRPIANYFNTAVTIGYLSVLAGIDTRINTTIDFGAELAFNTAIDAGDIASDQWIKQSASAGSVGGSICYILGRLDVGTYQPETGRFRLGAGATYIRTTVRGQYSRPFEGPSEWPVSYETTLNTLHPYVSASFTEYAHLTEHSFLTFRIQAQHHFGTAPHNVTWQYQVNGEAIPMEITINATMPWLLTFAIGVTF